MPDAEPASIFSAKSADFIAYQGTPWGRLRYTLARANLRRHLPAAPPRVLDAGGGNGLEALDLAAQGSQVALVDFSAEMLAEARRGAEAAGLSARLSLHAGELADLPALFPPGHFDLVLCHNVLQYVPDLEAALQVLVGAARSGGLLSLIAVNRYSEPYRLAFQQQDLEAARAALEADAFPAVLFGLPMRALAAADLRRPLAGLGCAVLREYGLRCVCDYLPGNERKLDPVFFAQLELLELALTDRAPYNLLARFFQVVARKNQIERGPGVGEAFLHKLEEA